MVDDEIERAIEAILFASGDPVPVDRIAQVLDVNRDTVLRVGQRLADRYEAGRRGIRLVRLNDSLQMHSAPEHAGAISRVLEQRRAPKLSQASLEVLAVVAYFQPVTRAYVEKMRGIDSSYTVGVLVERGLIEPCGHLEAVGRPTLYRTTDLFLRTMGISDLEELPPLPDVTGSDAAAKLQAQVDALRAEEEEQALEAEPVGETDEGAGSQTAPEVRVILRGPSASQEEIETDDTDTQEEETT